MAVALNSDRSTSDAKVSIEHVRETLTREYSTLRFRIEYGNYLSNHLLHAVVALHELGADEEKIAEYAAHYAERLEEEGPDHEDVVEHVETTELLTDEEAQALLGKRQKYDALLAYYAHDIAKLGADGAVSKHLPRLFSGLAGALLHGLIQLGYAYHIGGDRLVAEGLAYQHHCYLPFDEPSMAPNSEPLKQFTRQTVFEIAAAVTSNEFLLSEQDRLMAMSPIKDLDIGWIQQGVNVFSGHTERNSPEAFALIWEQVNAFDFSHFDGSCALDIVMWLYVMLKHNDFIILHAATSAWSLQQLEHLLSPSDKVKAWRVWLHVALTALVTSRSRDFREEDVCSPSESLENRLNELPSWLQLREQALSVPGFPDEHVYKMVQVAEDHATPSNSSTFLSPVEREFVARTAAITAITTPFKPYRQKPETIFIRFDESLVGNVKVTSDVQDIVEPAKAPNDPNNLDKHKNGVLNVTSVDGMNGVVVEDGVLTNDLVIDCGDASSLIVSTNKAYLELKDLVLAASDSGSVQIDAKSLFIGDVTMVSMLAPTLKTSELRVCFAASSQKAANGAANGDAVGLFLT